MANNDQGVKQMKQRANNTLADFSGLVSSLASLSIVFGLLLAPSANAQTTTGDATAGGTSFSSANCNLCHSVIADAPAIQNGANAGRIFQQATIGGMNGYTDASFSSTTENNIAAFIAQSRFGSIATQSVTHNTNKTITITNMRFGSAYSNLNGMTFSAPSRGSVSLTSSTASGEPRVIYNPDTGQCGSDSFQIQGTSSSTGRSTNVRTINVDIADPAIPVITSGSTGSANYNTFTSNAYTTTTSGGVATSFIASGLPPGLNISSSTGVVSGTPTSGGTFNATISSRNCVNGSLNTTRDTQAVTFTVTPDSQTITFNTQATTSRSYVPSGTFAISPVASASSGLSVTYSSGNTGVCTVSGTTVTIVAAGTCPIRANQAGNSNYSAASQVTQNVTITAASQTITFNAQTTPSRNFVSVGSTFAISPTASASSGLAITYSSGNTAVCTVSGTTVSMVAAGTCPIRANQAGNSNYTAASQVTQNVTINAIVPGAPTGVGGSAGDGTASISFTAPANTGGAPITLYTATCVPGGGGSAAGTNTVSPVAVTGMTNGTSYSCTVRATNSAGQGATSGSVNVLPTATPVAPTFTSSSSSSFTVLSPGTYQASATGVPAPTFSMSGTLPSGVSFNTGTAQLTGTPASGTAGTYPLTITVQNSAGTINQGFTLFVNKIVQTIDFPNPGSQVLNTDTVTLDATASSGLAVTYQVAPASASICSVAGNLVTKLAVGDCTIRADQIGNTNYASASQASETFAITQGSQTISFPEQTQITRSFSTGGTFGISPVATSSAGQTISYSSLTSDVCTVAGTTVTMVNIGICSIRASQAGNANYSAAVPVDVNVTIVQGSQSITFAGTQGAQSFSAGGTFALSPLGTASSGLTVTYSSTTTAVCTIAGTTITMVTAGTCTIAANQGGNAQFAAATQQMRNITINAVVPGPPTLTLATPGNGQASFQFTPPAVNGGSAITGYTVTCNPAGVTANGADTPITVTGLTNNVLYTCTVAASNSAGTGAQSSSMQVTPFAPSGAQLWNTVCTVCHATTPSGMQLNGAGTTATVLTQVRTVQPQMIDSVAVQALTSGELAAIAQYINDQLPNIVVTTPPNTAKTISVASHVTLTGSLTFNAVEVVSSPTNGSLGAWFAGGRSITYTPTNGFTGTDSFTYRPKHTGTGLLGDARTVIINVIASTATLTIAPAGLGEGTVNSNPFGVFNCYIAGGEIQSGVCNNVLFPLNTVITLTSTAFEGSVFGSWSGVSCAGGNSGPTCTFTLTSNTTVTATFNPDVPGTTAVSDLNDDGRSDLIFYQPSTGAFVGWLMNGLTITDAQYLIGGGSPWRIVTTGDLDGDGKADLIFKNDADGSHVAWFMNGLVQANAGYLIGANTGFEVVHTGDLNGDGKADLIWYQPSTGAYVGWLMNGLTILDAQYLIGGGSPWHITQVADLDGDGKADLIFKNNADGSHVAWFMNGLIQANAGYLIGANTGFEVVNAGDLNGDGKADLIWHQTATGAYVGWLMNGLTILDGNYLIGGGSGYSIVNVSDLDGDGKADLIFRHTDGSHVAWFMNGLIQTNAGCGFDVIK
jgi:hypothetical protein